MRVIYVYKAFCPHLIEHIVIFIRKINFYFSGASHLLLIIIITIILIFWYIIFLSSFFYFYTFSIPLQSILYIINRKKIVLFNRKINSFIIVLRFVILILITIITIKLTSSMSYNLFSSLLCYTFTMIYVKTRIYR